MSLTFLPSTAGVEARRGGVFSPRYVDFGADLTPPLGGPATRLNRLGARWALDVRLPPLSAEDARVWVSRLVQGRSGTVALRWPQSGLAVGAPGAPVVNGAQSKGAQQLHIRGLAGQYPLREGQFLTVTAGGRRQLYMAALQTLASAGGLVTAVIRPGLRSVPADGSAVELNPPLIEGLLQGREVGWTLEAARTVGLSFSIVEAA